MSKAKKMRQGTTWLGSESWLADLKTVPSTLLDLEQLRDFLNSLNYGDSLKYNLYRLPKFGGEGPGCSGGAFSWDHARILTYEEGLGYFIVSREDFDRTDVDLSELVMHTAVLV